MVKIKRDSQDDNMPLIKKVTNCIVKNSVAHSIMVINPIMGNIKALCDYVWHKFKEEGREKFCSNRGTFIVLIGFLKEVIAVAESRAILSQLLDKDNDVIRLLDNMSVCTEEEESS